MIENGSAASKISCATGRLPTSHPRKWGQQCFCSWFLWETDPCRNSHLDEIILKAPVWCSRFSSRCFCALSQPSTMVFSDFYWRKPICSRLPIPEKHCLQQFFHFIFLANFRLCVVLCRKHQPIRCRSEELLLIQVKSGILWKKIWNAPRSELQLTYKRN